MLFLNLGLEKTINNYFSQELKNIAMALIYTILSSTNAYFFLGQHSQTMPRLTCWKIGTTADGRRKMQEHNQATTCS